jgi:hypothetical protein
MIDRHFVGDVALAVLLAFPTLAFARPQATASTPAASPTMVEKAAIAERTTVERRYNLPN